MDRQYLQKQSDAKFRIDITDRMGHPVDPTKCDLQFEFYTSRSRRIVVGRKLGEAFPPGLKVEGGQVVVGLDNPRFTEGPLFARFRTRIYDAAFPDGFYDIASGEVNTGIEVVDN
ncbi:hypothetical protein BHU09_03620 [Tannerella sp. oral taxon 808]|nr:hypothetical protein BHU09_03620 [Tannerella sp. oral taxon 808]